MAAKNCQPEASAASASVVVKRLKNRADFIKAKNGARSHERAFVLQLRQRSAGVGKSGDTCLDDTLRVGFTVTKKIGNAVERNRIKRRLREAVRMTALPDTTKGQDAVLIGRRSALTIPFEHLVEDVRHAFVHAKMQRKSGNRRQQGKQPVAKRQ